MLWLRERSARPNLIRVQLCLLHKYIDLRLAASRFVRGRSGPLGAACGPGVRARAVSAGLEEALHQIRQ